MGMDVYGLKPKNETGEYFRASVWSWRPIHQLCETVLSKDLPDWGYNDGKGFRTQAECDNLAAKLEAYLAAFPNEKIEIESELRVNEKGLFLGRIGMDKGQSPYSTDQAHLQEFITFLRACGGFEIR